MPRVLRAIATLLVLLASYPGVELTSQGSAQAQSVSMYVALGDSIAAGVGASLPRTRGYPALVAERLERRFGSSSLHDNLAVPGETASTFLAGGQLNRFRTVIADVTGSGTTIGAVSLTLGGNEMLALAGKSNAERQAGLDAFSSAYRDALAEVRNEIGPETPLVVTTYYDLADGDPSITGTDSWWIAQFNEVIRSTANDLGATVADLAPSFSGRIDELTLYPVDVHPTNAGHRAIADVVWSSIGLDTTPPAIDAVDELSATRNSPTLHFSVSDEGQVALVQIDATDADVSHPVEIGPGEYVALVHLGDGESTPLEVTITAVDDAGNQAVHRVEITTETRIGEP